LSALVVLGLATMLLAAPRAGGEPAAGTDATSAAGRSTSEQVTDTNLLEQGRRLYLMNCASCHGAGAEGSDFAPSLRDAGAAANDFFMRTGRMPPGQLGVPSWGQRPQLSDEAITAIVAYTSTLGDGPAIPTVVADLGDVQRGWQLYINNCAACHGSTGDGGGIGGGVIAPPLHGADTLTVAEAMVVGPGPMPRFPFAQEDINAVAAYVEHLRTQPSPGGVARPGGPVPEGLIAALLGVGGLLVIVRWIARRAEFEPQQEALGDEDQG
jgi:ubiquinol-cytochrome c reductase cytochrome c subunit